MRTLTKTRHSEAPRIRTPPSIATHHVGDGTGTGVPLGVGTGVGRRFSSIGRGGASTLPPKLCNEKAAIEANNKAAAIVKLSAGNFDIAKFGKVVSMFFVPSPCLDRNRNPSVVYGYPR
jgi:hypothetical protein